VWSIRPEEKIMSLSKGIVLVGLVTALYYERNDHIWRTLAALMGLSIPDIAQRKFPNPPKILSPLYNQGTMAILSIFIAVHVSLVNVPLTTIDLFHREWRNADMISHFLGGMTVWLITTEILMNMAEEYRVKLSRKMLLLYSFLILLLLSTGWEIAEKISEGGISFIQESIANKLRDLLMNFLGALTGLYMVEKKGYPFKFKLRLPLHANKIEK